jgi:hypothetical protein
MAVNRMPAADVEVSAELARLPRRALGAEIIKNEQRWGRTLSAVLEDQSPGSA